MWKQVLRDDPSLARRLGVVPRRTCLLMYLRKAMGWCATWLLSSCAEVDIRMFY